MGITVTVASVATVDSTRTPPTSQPSSIRNVGGSSDSSPTTPLEVAFIILGFAFLVTAPAVAGYRYYKATRNMPAGEQQLNSEQTMKGRRIGL